MNEKARLAEQAHIYEDWQGIDRELTEAVGRLIASRVTGPCGVELGWGSGVMYPILREVVPRLDMVEADPTLAQRARDAIQAPPGVLMPRRGIVFECLFEKYRPLFLGYYSDVIISEVLEHVRNPRKLLRRATTWLRKGGRIHIAVPNGNSIHRLLGAMAGMGRPTDLGETDKRNGHRRVYTWNSIKREVERAGLEVVHMEGVLLKPFTGEGMNKLTQRERAHLFKLAPCCPKLCAEVYVECRTRESC